MKIYAYFSIAEATLKLLVAFLLTILFFDRLKLYSLLTLGSTLVIMLMYSTYCIRKFHCKIRWVWTPYLLNSILGFAGWNLSAQLAWIARTQGVNILLNLFWSVFKCSSWNCSTSKWSYYSVCVQLSISC